MGDLSQEFPDRAHEALRAELLAAIAAGQENAAGVDDSYYLTDVLFDLIDSLLTQLNAVDTRNDADQIRDTTAQADIDALQATVADLTARVTELEKPLP